MGIFKFELRNLLAESRHTRRRTQNIFKIKSSLHIKPRCQLRVQQVLLMY